MARLRKGELTKKQKKALEDEQRRKERELELAEEKKRIYPIIEKMARCGATKAAIARKLGWGTKTIYSDEYRWALDLWEQKHDEYIDVRTVTDENILADIAKRQSKGIPLEQWEVLRIERARERMQDNAYRIVRQRLENRQKAIELELMKAKLELHKRQMHEPDDDCLVQLMPMTEADEAAEIIGWGGAEYIYEQQNIEGLDNESI